MPEYFQTCISCDDPIEVSGFHLHVCEQCRRDEDGSAGASQPIIACRLYLVDSDEKSIAPDSR